MKPHWLEILLGCFHKWEKHFESPIERNKATVGRLYILKCEKCGDMKQKQFEL